MIEQKDWIWHGYPGHFIGSHDCEFRMCTEIGEFLISTVGDYKPSGGERVEIGAGRTFETMVFKWKRRCTSKKCGCGLPKIDGYELYSAGYVKAGVARDGHLRICQAVAEESLP